jgi:hypothetical protein
MGDRYSLRPPEYLDVDLTGDGHGHHVAGTPFVYSHNWHLLHGKGPKFRLKKPGISGGVRSKHTSVMRSSRTTSMVSGPEGQEFLSHYQGHLDKTVEEFAGEDGTKLSAFHLDVNEWKTRWDSADPSERVKLTQEMEAHVELVNKVLAAGHDDLLDQHRSTKIGDLKKHDEFLKKTAAGRAIIKVRDKFVTDGVLKKYDWIKKQAAAHGLDSAGHILTGLAAAVIVSHLLGAPLLAPVLHHLVEQHVGMLTGDRVVEGIIAACVSMHVTGKLLKPLERLTSREHKIEKAKSRLKRLEGDITEKV